MYDVCMYENRGFRGMLPQEFRCSEIASEVILEQKQSQGSHMVCKVLHPVFDCITYPYMDTYLLS